MSKKYYTIDFYRLSLLLMPTFLRTGLIAAFLRAIVSPLQMLYAVFGNFRADADYKLSHNSQVCYLQKVLNDTFDNTLRRITITDVQRYRRMYLYLRTEIKPHYLGKLYVNTAGELADIGFDFAVNLNGVRLDEGNLTMMRSIINYYKAASKRYKIN